MTRDPAIIERPPSIPSETVRVRTGCGEFYMTVSKDPNCFEVELHLGKSGSCQQAMLEAIRGLLTICRRQLNPIPRKLIIHQLKGIRCPQDSSFIPSCPEAIARVLEGEWGEVVVAKPDFTPGEGSHE
jgi:hypothetical protein